MRTRQQGFTLIELMIVVVIVGILAAIALPSYKDSVRKGRRANAESFLMDVAQRQQQFLLDNRSYATTIAALGFASVPGDISGFYTVTITTSSPPPGFTATATAIGDQLPDQTRLGGPLTINNRGEKTPASAW